MISGNSVYENSRGVWADRHVPVEFLTVYRDEDYIRQHTKGMTTEETEEFAMAYYYGPSIDVSESSTIIYDTEADDIVRLYKLWQTLKNFDYP